MTLEDLSLLSPKDPILYKGLPATVLWVERFDEPTSSDFTLKVTGLAILLPDRKTLTLRSLFPDRKKLELEDYELP